MKNLTLVSLILLFIPVILCIKVTLPSYNGPPLDVYSGFVTVDTNHGRALHYMLIKAEENPDTKPLIVWFQGGPGCSGLLGLFTENGPYTLSRDSSGKTIVNYNNLGWIKFGNLLWVEQPAFVGFSYSNTSSDISTNDTHSASDNLIFVKNFIKSEFPEYMGRDLWFTGESYGGVYVPMLSDLVVNTPELNSQFQGFMIGNAVFGCSDDDVVTNIQVNLLYWHGLVSYTNFVNWTTNGCDSSSSSSFCQDLLNTINSQLGEIDQELTSDAPPNTWPSLDPDDLFQDFCTGNGTLDFVNTPTPDNPCNMEVGDLLQEYLNRADVQMALGVTRPTNWQVCADIDYNSNEGSMIPHYLDMIKKKPDIKILVYSGDIDIMTVPFAYTQPCILKFSGDSKTLWQPWFVNGATAGYYESFEFVTYATIKGGGHETPQYQPQSSHQMISRFIKNGNLGSDENRAQFRKRKGRLSQYSMLRKFGVNP